MLPGTFEFVDLVTYNKTLPNKYNILSKLNDFVAVKPLTSNHDDLYLEKQKQRCLLLFKRKGEQNDSKWIITRPVPQLLLYTKYTETNYNNCKHNITALLEPMYLLELGINSSSRFMSLELFKIAHTSAAEHINKYISTEKGQKFKFHFCRQCAVKLLIKTQCLSKLIYYARYVMQNCEKLMEDSIRFNHFFYTGLLIMFVIRYPNITRFIFKEVDESLQIEIIEFIICFHLHLNTFLTFVPQKQTNLFCYGFTEWEIIRNVFGIFFVNNYKYWRKDYELLNKDIGEYVIESAANSFKFIMDIHQRMEDKNDTMSSMYQNVLFEACLVAQCMKFKREMIPVVFELFQRYLKTYKNKFIDNISTMMQLLLLTCNNTSYGRKHRKDCRTQTMKMSIEYKEKHMYCHRRKCKRKNKKKLKLCANCRCVYFCSRHCQKKEWKERHRFDCHKLKQLHTFIFKL